MLPTDEELLMETAPLMGKSGKPRMVQNRLKAFQAVNETFSALEVMKQEIAAAQKESELLSHQTEGSLSRLRAMLGAS